MFGFTSGLAWRGVMLFVIVESSFVGHFVILTTDSNRHFSCVKLNIKVTTRTECWIINTVPTIFYYLGASSCGSCGSCGTFNKVVFSRGGAESSWEGVTVQVRFEFHEKREISIETCKIQMSFREFGVRIELTHNWRNKRILQLFLVLWVKHHQRRSCYSTLFFVFL